jgi:hypothetical protein
VLRLLLVAFVPSGPVIFGLDDMIERRRGGMVRYTYIRTFRSAGTKFFSPVSALKY